MFNHTWIDIGMGVAAVVLILVAVDIYKSNKRRWGSNED